MVIITNNNEFCFLSINFIVCGFVGSYQVKQVPTELRMLRLRNLV